MILPVIFMFMLMMLNQVHYDARMDAIEYATGVRCQRVQGGGFFQEVFRPAYVCEKTIGHADLLDLSPN